MERVKLVNHKGKDIVYLDFSNIKLKNKSELIESVEKAKQIIKKSVPKSALVLTDVTDTNFDMELTSIFKDYTKHNTPYVKASALVGVVGYKKIILESVKRFTGRNYVITENSEEALNWLSEQ